MDISHGWTQIELIGGKLQFECKPEEFRDRCIHKLQIFRNAQRESEDIVKKIERKVPADPEFTHEHLLLEWRARSNNDKRNPEVPTITMNQLRIIKAEAMLKCLTLIAKEVIPQHHLNQDKFKFRTRATELECIDMKSNYLFSEEEKKLEPQIPDEYNWRKDHELKKLEEWCGQHWIHNLYLTDKATI
jgi:hypothetical protein